MRLALALATLAGCGPLLGIDDDFSSPDAAPPIVSHVGVTGHSSITYHTELAAVTVPEDLSQLVIDAYILDDAGLHVYPGTGAADGSFTIPDVPARDYHLRLVPRTGGLPMIWHLQGHDVDLSRDQMGRPDAAAIELASPVSLTAPAMRRFLSSDDVNVYASVLPREVRPAWSANRPDLGLDHLTNATFDWAGNPAFDDNGLWIVHHGLPQTTPDRLEVTTTTEAAHVTGVRQVAGAVLPVSFAFTPGTPSNTTMAVDLAKLRTQPTRLELASLEILATPDRGTGTLAGPAVLRASVRFDERAPPALHFLDYADPFPEAWSRAAVVTYLALPRLFIRPPAIQTAFGDRIAVQYVAAPGTELVVPALTARPPGPTGITLDGAPIGDGVHAPDEPLRLAWDAVPAASGYVVTFFVMSPAGQGETFQVATTLPALVLPGGTIADQHRVAISIAVALGDPLEPAVRRMPRQRTLYDRMAGLLLMSSTCGNGMVEAPEACDTSQESATCNFDCTPATCGDSIANAAAREECDLGFPGRTCDAQCHAVVCGDGVVATTAGEQCEDGNTLDGDGCSADCLVEELTRCGDAQVDPGEQCDDGNDDPRDSCTPTCKEGRCGDGVVAPVLGEECDDKNPIDGDGCSIFCRVERCGDGRVIYPEACDDNNTLPGDGCAPDCRRE